MSTPRITIDELKGRLDNGEELTILDVRNPIDYAKSEVRLPGAVRMQAGEVDARAGELDPAREVVAYCT